MTGSAAQLAGGDLVTSVPQTTIAATTSAPPAGTIYVNSTGSFPFSGTLFIQTSQGQVQITYTGTGTGPNGTASFTGVTFVTGSSTQLAAGNPVTLPGPIPFEQDEYVDISGVSDAQEITSVQVSGPNTGR